MDLLSIGMNVEIRRSDNRVHAAVISNLEAGNQMVDVEWFEQGETKGKRVDLPTLFRLNPKISGLLGQTQNGSQPAKPKQSRKTILVPQTAASSSAEPQKPSKESQRNIVPKNKPLSPVIEPSSDEYSPIRPLPSAPRSTVAAASVAAANASLPVPSKRHATVAAATAAAAPAAAAPAVSQPLAAAPRARQAAAATLTAKSEVVLKTEEIERNREERRALRMADKRKRDDYMKCSPNNPNWEFLKMIREYRVTIDFRPLRITDEVKENRICVCVRKRPLSKKETAASEIEVITIPTKDQIICHQPQQKVDLTKYLENVKYRFDYSFDDTVDNEMVYRFTAQPLVKSIFEGGFATCFAYGQTGSGKTHTMGGDIEGRTQDCSKGIYALAAIDVFNLLNDDEYGDSNLYVVCSFFELYGSKAFDLLSKRKPLRILEDNKHNVQIVGLQEKNVERASDVLKLIREGSALRTAGQTSANSNSSRSHAIFQIVLKRFDDDEVHGKFSLIDLAGNERGADTTSSDRTTRLEGAEINKSLLSLKECIRAMGMMKDYVPFRGSKLTLVLRDSFIGRKAKTCMIATISPGLVSAENTLNTLRYADR